ncbi:MAG: hypothetical protein ABL949_00855 [Fimbriimonadaceae bacterium]
MVESALLEIPGVTFAPVNHVCFSPDGTMLAASTVDREVAVFRGNEVIYQSNFMTEDHRIRPHDSIRSIIFSGDGQSLYVAWGDILRRINLYSGSVEWARQSDPNMAFLITTPVNLARSSMGQVACAYADGHVELYDANGVLEGRFSDNAAPCLMSYISGNRLAGTDRFSITVWSSGGRLLHRAKGTRRMFALAASEESDLLAVRSLHEVLIMRTSDWQAVGHADTRPGYPKLLFIAGDCLASLDADGFSLYNPAGEEVKRFETHAYRPIAMAHHPKQGLAVSGSDGSVHLYPL